LADGRAQGLGMKNWRRPLAYLAVIALAAVAYFIASGSRGIENADVADAAPLDPGYAARDAEVIETGYDGRERYRLKASVIRQRIESGFIDLEHLEMDYHAGAQSGARGAVASSDNDAVEIWHLTSDHGQVRADGDDVQLNGNVRVTGPAPGSGKPLSLRTESMRINTPTEFIETEAPVRLNWAGHQLDALGFEADLKRGNLRLKSDIHGKFSPQ
jgi:LPS export ABC transporter protein LptC